MPEPLDPALVALHARSLETGVGDLNGTQYVDHVIAELLGLRYTDSEAALVLAGEIRRVLELVGGHYAQYLDPTPQTVAMVGFLQGVTYAVAARELADEQ